MCICVSFDLKDLTRLCVCVCFVYWWGLYRMILLFCFFSPSTLICKIMDPSKKHWPTLRLFSHFLFLVKILWNTNVLFSDFVKTRKYQNYLHPPSPMSFPLCRFSFFLIFYFRSFWFYFLLYCHFFFPFSPPTISCLASDLSHFTPSSS